MHTRMWSTTTECSGVSLRVTVIILVWDYKRVELHTKQPGCNTQVCLAWDIVKLRCFRDVGWEVKKQKLQENSKPSDAW